MAIWGYYDHQRSDVRDALAHIKTEFLKKLFDDLTANRGRINEGGEKTKYIEERRGATLSRLALQYIREHRYTGDIVSGVALGAALRPDTSSVPRRLPTEFNPVLAKMAFYATARSLEDPDDILRYSDPMRRLNALYDQLRLFSSLPPSAFSSQNVYRRIQEKNQQLMSRKTQTRSALRRKIATNQKATTPPQRRRVLSRNNNRVPPSPPTRGRKKNRKVVAIASRRHHHRRQGVTYGPQQKRKRSTTTEDSEDKVSPAPLIGDEGGRGETSPVAKKIRTQRTETIPLSQFENHAGQLDASVRELPETKRTETAEEQKSRKPLVAIQDVPKVKNTDVSNCSPLRVGDTVTSPGTGRMYTCQKLLGEGGFGVVWKVVSSSSGEEKEGTQTVWALKVMTVPAKVNDPQSQHMIEMTRKEFSLLQEVNRECDSILHYEEMWTSSEEGGQQTCIYLVMEFISGYDLFDFQSTYPIDFRLWSFLACRIKEAIQCLHRLGIAQRDLKPENIMIEMDPEGTGISRVVLIDFGFACKMDQCQGVSGTVGYLAPELLKTGVEKSPLSFIQADLWSMGVVLYQLAYKRELFSNSDLWSLVNLYPRNDFARVLKPFFAVPLSPDIDPKDKGRIDRAIADLLYGPVELNWGRTMQNRRNPDVELFTFTPELRRFTPEFNEWFSC